MIKQKVRTWSVWGRCRRLLYLQGKAEGASVRGTVSDDEGPWLLLSQQIDCWNSLWLEAQPLYTNTLSSHPRRLLREKSHNLLSPGGPFSCLLSAGFAYFLFPNEASRSPTLPQAAICHFLYPMTQGPVCLLHSTGQSLGHLSPPIQCWLYLALE